MNQATPGSTGRVRFTADAHRDNGKRFIVTADEKLTAFMELESGIWAVQNKDAEDRVPAVLNGDYPAVITVYR